MELKIEYIDIDKLEPYERNARKHQEYDVDVIATSIEKFGMNDPIGIWSDHNVVVEGHGRLIACKKLGMKTVPVIRLDHLTDEERREYGIVHNKSAELSEWDFDVLNDELSELEFDGFDIEWIDEDSENLECEEREEYENPYSTKTEGIQYEPKLENQPHISELYDNAKTEQLIANINESNCSLDIKEFLKLAAQRHTIFDYQKIAEYYCHADKGVQRLFEESALVVIDFDDAIKNGYVALSKRLEEIRNEEN